MAKFKVQKDSIVRTQLTCPCKWVAVCTENKEITMEFRLGVLKVFYEGKLHIEDSNDLLDISSYIEDENMLELLDRNNLLEKDDDVKSS